MVILSIYPFPFHVGLGHDAGVAIINGEEIFACEESKLIETVMPCFTGIPQRSLAAAFKYFSLEPRDVDHWVFGQPYNCDVDYILRMFFHHLKMSSKEYFQLQKERRIHFINHHLSHAALSIYGSGFKDGVYLTYDGGGDEAQPSVMSWGTFSENNINNCYTSQKEILGIANFYDYMTNVSGFISPYENGKLMGLSAYGNVNKDLYNQLSNYIEIDVENNKYAFCNVKRKKISPYRFHKYNYDDYNYFKYYFSATPPDEFINLIGKYSPPDIAATTQCLVEDKMCKMVEGIISKCSTKKIVLSGGLFQNILLNKKISEIDQINDIYIPMAPNDSGLALGAALALSINMGHKRPNNRLTPFLGPSFNDTDIKKILLDYPVEFSYTKEIAVDVAKLIANGNIVGWFQGRSELGPRALGARSILADPRVIKNKAKLNQNLKRRDWFMPYAPSLLLSKATSYFDRVYESPYMALGLSVKPEVVNMIPCAVHVNNISRPQMVNSSDNPLYNKLITEFEKITNLPIILNTSFNRHGIPTISSPRQAVEHLINGCFDYLAIGSYIVKIKNSIPITIKETIPEEYFLLIENLIPAIYIMLDNPTNNKLYNKTFYHRNGKIEILFSPEKKKIIINNNSIKIDKIDREELYKRIIPLLLGQNNEKNF